MSSEMHEDPNMTTAESDPAIHVESAETGDDDCAPSFFKESEECAALLHTITSALQSAPSDVPLSNDERSTQAFAQFEKILQEYLEQPHLLKRHLSTLIEPLVSLMVHHLPQAEAAAASEASAAEAKKPSFALGQCYDEFDVDAPRRPLHATCHALYVVVKVAGAKSCTSYFPHEVRYIEQVFYALQHWQRTPVLNREWEVRYCLLLWMSNLILVPFALHTIDSSLSAEGQSLSQQVLRCATEFLSDSSKCREAAALLIARIMTRADGEVHRVAFFEFVETMLKDPSGSNNVQLCGVLLAVARTLKLGKRRELIQYAPKLIPLVVALAEAKVNDTQLCKTAVKVAQRLALTLLRQRAAAWRYVKRVGSLETNLKLSAGVSAQAGLPIIASSGTAAEGHESDEDENNELVEDDTGLEEVIGFLNQCLSYSDTIVRWSAAKGIGRVCSRLSKTMADDVVDAFMEVFESTDNDAGWHGGMLAVAELCRRSILFPHRFEAIIPIVSKGLIFDVGRGTYSVGSHVRDAACYVCWSVARAYDPVDLEPYVHRLSNSLVVASLFDREVNVRRAASAALQECVGRLGNFPNGISLVTTMDFFSLATLKGAFVSVAPQVAVYDAYRSSMIDSLLHEKLSHWDKEVRKTAAVAFGKVCALAPDASVVASILTTTLLPRVADPMLPVRHGALLGIAGLLNEMPTSTWDATLLASMVQLIPTLEQGRQFRGRGGEFIRQACLGLLDALAARQLPLPEFVFIDKISGEKAKARTIGKLQVFFEDTWKQILEWLQNEAADVYRRFAKTYFREYQEGFHGKVVKQLLEGCVEGKAAIERRGTVLILGTIPPTVLAESLLLPPPAASSSSSAEDCGASSAPSPSPLRIWELLLTASRDAVALEKNPDLRDAETRRNAVESLIRLLTAFHASSVPSPTLPLSRDFFDSCFEAYCAAFDDYSVDKRGDVGSMVRLKAISLSASLLEWLATEPLFWSSDRVLRVLGMLVKQSVEKIDRLRSVSGQALHDLLSNASLCEAIRELLSRSGSNEDAAASAADFAVLRRCFVESKILDWGSPNETFPVIAGALLSTTSFAPYVMEGIVVSVGGMSIHVLKASEQALVAAFRGESCERNTNTSLDAQEQEQRLTSRYRLSQLLLDVARKHEHSDRVVVPLYLTIDGLMNKSLFAESLWGDVVQRVVSETKHFTADIQKLLPLVGVLGTLCRAGEDSARQAAWAHALVMIAGRFPKVRAKVGTDLFTALLFLGDLPGLDLEKARQHLAATTWDDTSAPKVRGARNALYAMLGLEAPTAAAAGGDMKATTKAAKTAVGSYTYLVNEAGY